MRETRSQLYLEEKSLGSDLRGDLGAQDLERYLAIVPEVVREKYDRHPSFAELAPIE
jgi:hypothetical protein